MNSIREHWDQIKEVRAELVDQFGEFGTIYLMSLKRRAKGVLPGRVCTATVHIAAMCISQDTHRLATPEEIADWQLQQAETRKQILAEKSRTDTKVNVDLGDQFVRALQQVAGMNVPQPAAAAPVPVATVTPPTAKSAATSKSFD